jgi:tetratricopeptide (TPR) repeat protein
VRLWILQRYQTYARMVLLAALFLSAIWFWRPTVDVFDLTKITILWVLGLIALLLWIASSAERGVWVPRMKLFWAAGAFLAAEAVATVFSQDPALSVFGLYHRYGGLIPFCLYATIGLMLVGLYWERPQDLKEVARALALASAFVTGYVLIEKLGLDWIPWRDSNGQPPSFPVSTLGNSDFAGGYLAIASPCFLYLVLSAKNRYWRYGFAAAFFLDLLALYYTDSRGAFIAVGVMIAALALLYRSLLPRWMRLTTLAGAIAAVIVAVLLLFHPFMKSPPSIFNAAGAFSPFRTGTLQERSWYWIDGLRIFEHHPILGTGPDTYYANYPRYRLPQDGAKLGLTITDKPHNIFVEYAADSGILGVGTYLVLVGLTLWFGYRRARQLEGNLRLLMMAFLGMLVAYLAQGFFSIDIPPLAVLGWVAIACIAVLADPGGVAAREAIAAARAAQSRGGARPKKKKSGGVARPAAKQDPYRGTRVLRQGPWRWPVDLAAVVVAAVLIVLGVRPFYADTIAHNGQLAQNTQGESPTAVAAIYEHAAKDWPLEPSYPSLAGAVYESQGDSASSPAAAANWFNRALVQYRRSLDLQPENVFYVMNLARCYTSWGSTDPSKFTLANRYWQEAVSIDPTDWQVHQQYASMLGNWSASHPTDTALLQRYANELDTVVRIAPTQVSEWVSLVKADRALGQTATAQAALASAIEVNPSNSSLEALVTTPTASSGGAAGG